VLRPGLAGSNDTHVDLSVVRGPCETATLDVLKVSAHEVSAGVGVQDDVLVGLLALQGANVSDTA
jgi:hypothetical protein